MTALRELRIIDISPNPDQPRKQFGQAALDELTDSIRSVGLLEPIIVRPAATVAVKADGEWSQSGPIEMQARWIIVAGERRWRAAYAAGLDTIPAVIREDLDDGQAFELSMIENVIRADMNPMEEADGYQQLVDAGMTVADISARLGKSQQEITYRLRLRTLAPAIRDLVAAGQVPVWHGALLARLSTEGQFRVIRAQTSGMLKFASDFDRLVGVIEEQETQGELFADVPTLTPTELRKAKQLRTALEEVLEAIERATALAAEVHPVAVDETDGLFAEEVKRAAARMAAAVHENRARQLGMAE